jgi:cytidylate kinase
MNYKVYIFSREHMKLLCHKPDQSPLSLSFSDSDLQRHESYKNGASRLIFERTGRMAHINYELPIMPKTADWREFDPKEFSDTILIAELLFNEALQVPETPKDHDNFLLLPIGNIFKDSPATKVIAVDGPAKAGKGTYCPSVADLLGVSYLETGLLYRGMAKYLSEFVKPLPNATEKHQVAFEKLVRDKLPDASDISFDIDKSEFGVKDKRYSRSDLKNEQVNNLVAHYSEIPAVREVVKQVQTNIAKTLDGLLIEGRDITTHIFPDAPFKFYVTACDQMRALRAFKENQADTYVQALDSIRERDDMDSNRPTSPLRAAAGAVVLDSTHLLANDAIKAMFLVCAGMMNAA